MSETKNIDVDVKSPGLSAAYTRDAGVDDDTTIPEGQLDPVYEKKARLLNRAVSSYVHILHPCCIYPDYFPRYKTSAWVGTNGSSSS